jgi:hypothetical protein
MYIGSSRSNNVKIEYFIHFIIKLLYEYFYFKSLIYFKSVNGQYIIN